MKFGIGELSQQARVKVPTIRYYERNSLIPLPSRTDTGHRLYEALDVCRLRFIRFARLQGLAICEIRAVLEMLAEGNSEELDIMVEFLLERETAIHELRRQLTAISGAIRSGELDEASALARLAALAQPASLSNNFAENRTNEEEAMQATTPGVRRKRAKS
ncbi:helix-turn-helix domain-containing protein [Methylobacterium goesingense]|uniref:DNA-binding transcriptional MerR regulator n=1 Tax=Methylobacterium goesingense TaxID=243690 RepID=A0ABV2L819_9HYPH|nr:MerR family transcriptional regulator [Methylobacterium goesingense]